MIRRLTDTESLYVRSMGKALRVTAIATSDAEANAHMSTHRDDACIAVFGSFVLMAHRYDHGIVIPREAEERSDPRRGPTQMDCGCVVADGRWDSTRCTVPGVARRKGTR